MNCSPLFATSYLPPVSYFSQIACYETITIEQWETFPKQTLRNRAVIMTANGLLPLSVPVVRTNGNHTHTKDIAICYNEPWNIRHWRAIVSAYSAAPYFLFYRDHIEKILLSHYRWLIDLNDDLTRTLLHMLKIACELSRTTDFVHAATGIKDHRDICDTKKNSNQTSVQRYSQVFETRFDFQPNLSVIDLLFNMGPDAKRLLTKKQA